MPLFRRGLRDRLGEPKNAAKMPRAVKMAIVADFSSQKCSLAAVLGRERQRAVNG
jgi:hypothetical protein